MFVITGCFVDVAKFYAIFSDPTIFFCFTVETGAMEFGKLVRGRVQSQPLMDTDVVVEPRRHVKKQNNGGSECSLTFTVSLRRIQSWKRRNKSQQLGEVNVEISSTRTIPCMTLTTKQQQETIFFLLTTHGKTKNQSNFFRILNARCQLR